MDYLERLKRFDSKWSYQSKFFKAYFGLAARLSPDTDNLNPILFVITLFIFPVIAIGPFVATVLLLDNAMNFWASLVPAGFIQWQYQKLRDPK
jgi:Trk-type K+ transport system membrane component